MRILRAYFARETFAAVAFVLAGFLALFSFFDFVAELEDIGQGNYQFQHALAYVLLSLPNHTYELMPIVSLIGTIYALAQFASNSEFTAMRAAGLGRFRALGALVRIGLVLAIITAGIGEIIAPPAEKWAQSIRLGAMGGQITGQFRSGIWIKDTVRDEQNQPLRQRFVNIGHLDPSGKMRKIRVYEFDTDLRLTGVLSAPSGYFAGSDRWRLDQVTQLDISTAALDDVEAIRVDKRLFDQRSWTSDLTPELLSVMAIAPDRMSAFNLAGYVEHLRSNQQDASRYELALWKKITYPLAVLVMMALALPFAYLHARAGSIGVKVFAGVMLGVAFHFLNGLFAHLGLLNTWPAWVSATVPSIAAFVIAMFMLARVGGAR
ncbi:MAG: LPS export ABC transporter permease LptG [Burkholderiaceae bacterium]